ncbi:MAG: hypothetical protein AB1898_13385 [Acidobacteriota bacterium]
MTPHTWHLFEGTLRLERGRFNARRAARQVILLLPRLWNLRGGSPAKDGAERRSDFALITDNDLSGVDTRLRHAARDGAHIAVTTQGFINVPRVKEI